MRRTAIAAVCSAVIAAAAGAAFAHPPSAMTVTYDVSASTLKIEAVHPVKDENDHYIKNISVMLNDKEIVNQKFAKQLDKQKEPAVYIVPGVKAGDQFSVAAECNRFGTKKVSMKVQ